MQSAPTTHQGLLDWVREVAALTQPAHIYWVDGTQEEYDRLAQELVDAGTFVRLSDHEFPNSYAAFSDPDDVARVEERTFICSEKEEDAGPTNNWMAPGEMRGIMTDLYRGSMRGRTMWVVPFCMGPLDAEDPKLGVEITDSEYVVVSMRTMTRMGAAALDLAYVAAGRMDGFWERRLRPWDISAGLVLVREAGMRVEGWTPDERPEETGTVITAPVPIFDRLAAALRADR